MATVRLTYIDVLPIDPVCSTDELAATMAPRDVPAALTHQIKQRLRDAVGDHITCSIGYAPNRWLAKIAADLDMPDGLTVLHPRDLPGRQLTLDLEDLPGVSISAGSMAMPDDRRCCTSRSLPLPPLALPCSACSHQISCLHVHVMRRFLFTYLVIYYLVNYWLVYYLKGKVEVEKWRRSRSR